MNLAVAIAGPRVPHPHPRGRPLLRRARREDAAAAVLHLLPAGAREVEAERDRVRDRLDPARRLREDPRDAPPGRRRPRRAPRARDRGGALAGRAGGARRAGARRRTGSRTPARRCPSCGHAVERAELSEPARRSGRARRSRTSRTALSQDAYWRAPAWKRIAVIVAGPADEPRLRRRARSRSSSCSGVPVEATRTVEEVVPGSPAAAAGLQPGDRIVAVGGRDRPVRESGRGDPRAARASRSPSRSSGTASESDLRGRAARLRRGHATGSASSFGLRYESYGLAGIGRATRPGDHLGGDGGDRPVARPHRHGLGPRRGRERRSASCRARASRSTLGFRYYLRILALISLSLALLNLLPLLPLDGGHIAFSLLERIRGRAIPRVAYERASRRRDRARPVALRPRAHERRRPAARRVVAPSPIGTILEIALPVAVVPRPRATSSGRGRDEPRPGGRGRLGGGGPRA